MAEPFIIEPDVIRDHPPRGEEQPEWLIALAAYVTEAAKAGETVSLTARVKTLTPAEVADRLGISRATISRRIAAGDIRTIKVGNRHRITLNEYDRFRRSLMGAIVDHYADDLATDLGDS